MLPVPFAAASESTLAADPAAASAAVAFVAAAFVAVASVVASVAGGETAGFLAQDFPEDSPLEIVAALWFQASSQLLQRLMPSSLLVLACTAANDLLFSGEQEGCADLVSSCCLPIVVDVDRPWWR